ncbi:hypothetical protein FKM82_020866, partial [Ascaphus truei]
VSNSLYQLERKPLSKKGYSLGARTALRFPPDKKIQTPDPAEYQSFWAKERAFSPCYAPFSANAARFPDKVTDISLYPSPGTYDHNTERNRMVSWPGKFGAPDWSAVPTLERRALKSELPEDKEFRKHRNRLAYLSLYYG